MIPLSVLLFSMITVIIGLFIVITMARQQRAFKVKKVQRASVILLCPCAYIPMLWSFLIGALLVLLLCIMLRDKD